MKKAIAEYEAKLASHDWFYERSDDPTVYRKGKTELDALRIMQKYLDPDRKIWKRYEQS